MTVFAIVVTIAVLAVAGMFIRYWREGRLPPSVEATEDYRTIVTRAINNAAEVLAYASRSGTKLDDSAVQAVLVAHSAGDAITNQQEAAFWAASSSISKAIAPVTLETIKSTVSTNGRSAAAIAARNYRLRTLATLAALLLFQVYWLIGATVTSDLNDIRLRLNKLSEQGQKDKAAIASLSDKDTDFATKKSALDLASDQWNDLLWREKISAWADFEVLKNWNVSKQLLIPNSKAPPPPFTSAATTKPNDTPDDDPVKASDYFLWVFTPENAEEVQTAQIVLTALLKYILPILYGALGASAYIVRTLADEVKSYTFSAGSIVRYELRFYLGAVAGLSIAWFTSDTKSAETAGVLQSLSPLALAFLAGYSVDLLFSFLDRLTSVFSTPASKSQT
jgi:hypothetical protein